MVWIVPLELGGFALPLTRDFPKTKLAANSETRRPGCRTNRAVGGHRDGLDDVVRQAVVGNVVGIGLAVKAGDAAVRAKPQHTVGGHSDRLDDIICQAIVNGVASATLPIKATSLEAPSEEHYTSWKRFSES